MTGETLASQSASQPNKWIDGEITVRAVFQYALLYVEIRFRLHKYEIHSHTELLADLAGFEMRSH